MKKCICLILSLVLINLVTVSSVFSETQIESSHDVKYNGDNEFNNIPIIPEITEEFIDESVGLTSFVDNDSYECLSLGSIPDGIYAFKNLGNEDRWMDIERNKTSPGFHVQQYNNNISPSIEYTESCLFKITQYKNTGKYIIRLMLNEKLSFDFDEDGYVITKEIPANDCDVGISDTFIITYNVTGYTIRPYGSSYSICANQTTASGASGAPESFLRGKIASSAGDYGKWIIEGYQSQPKDGIYAFGNMGNGLRWMDIERNKTVPGYHLQQYANNNNSPAEEYLASGLFKVTRIESSGSYIIRSMLNQNLSFGFSSDGLVLTKTIAEKDEDVPLSNTFYLCFINGGYIIRAYGSNHVVGANVTTASGASGAPDSYLKKTSFNDVDKYSIWRMQGYQTLFDSGVYYISNSYGVAEGSFDRIMGTLDATYTENTSVQQYRCDVPEIDSGLSRIWVVKRIYENYYTIASSQKTNMYISWNNQSPDLMEVSIFDVESTDEILWKFEGNEIVGYTITSKATPTASITAPLGTANELLLEFSDITTTTNERNYWKMNRIQDAYLVSICAVAKGNGSSTNGDFGHCWISLENLSRTDLRLIHVDVPKNDYITVGKWGGSEEKHSRMWYNVERYNYSVFSSKTGVQISVVMDSGMINDLNQVLQANCEDIWQLGDNCTHLACIIWKALDGEKYNSDIPSELQNKLSQSENAIIGVNLTYSNACGYYYNGNYITEDSPPKVS